MAAPNPADFVHEPALQAGDIFFARRTGLVDRLIRLCTRSFGEPRSRADHVGVVVRGGPFGEAVVVEALRTVKRRRLVKGYANRHNEVAVYRPTNLSNDERRVIVHTAQAYVGRRYGWARTAANSLDWLLQGAYVFRRIAGCENYPTRSWVVAEAFDKAGKHFGVEPGTASLDDIWNFVTDETDKYQQIREPLPLNGDNELF
ncbi:MAG: hypothetical protein U5Q44_00475 [Dehalococcoidia bacterium]|nr:hypothetical protein [Dehalococcoidia bacterium]